MKKINLYTFNTETLEYEPVSYRLFWVPFLAVVLGFAVNLLFAANICTITDWRGKEEKVTITEKLEDIKRINSYK